MMEDITSNPLAGFDAADWKNVLDLIGDQKAEIARLRAREKRMLEWLNYYRAKWMGEAAMPCPPMPEPLDLQDVHADQVIADSAGQDNG